MGVRASPHLRPAPGASWLYLSVSRLPHPRRASSPLWTPCPPQPELAPETGARASPHLHPAPGASWLTALMVHISPEVSATRRCGWGGGIPKGGWGARWRAVCVCVCVCVSVCVCMGACVQSGSSHPVRCSACHEGPWRWAEHSPWGSRLITFQHHSGLHLWM